MAKTPQHNRTFTAACVQFHVARGDVAANLERAQAGLAAAADGGAKLAVLPEMWPTSFVPEITDALIAESHRAEDAIIAQSRELDLVVVGGGIERSGGRDFNRAMVIERGNVLGSYRKIHLFSPNAESRCLAAGDQPLVAETSLGRIGVLICYDIRFPELVRYHFYRGVEVLVVPSQWPEARAEHWRTLLKARAIENEMFVVGCNRTGTEPSLKTEEMLYFPGNSRIFDPMGETLGCGTGEEGAVLGEIELRKIQSMRRILPIEKDKRPDLYHKLWNDGFRGGQRREP